MTRRLVSIGVASDVPYSQPTKDDDSGDDDGGVSSTGVAVGLYVGVGVAILLLGTCVGLAVSRRVTQKRLSEVARSVINAPTVIIDSTNRKESTKATGEERRTFDKAPKSSFNARL